MRRKKATGATKRDLPRPGSSIPASTARSGLGRTRFSRKDDGAGALHGQDRTVLDAADGARIRESDLSDWKTGRLQTT